MKIMQFSDCFFPTVNGVSSSVRTLVKTLSNAGHKVLLAVPDTYRPLPEFCTGSNFKNVIYIKLKSAALPQLKDNRAAFPFPLSAWRRIEEFKPDIIHIHTPGTMGIMGLLWAKFHHIPYIFTHHTLFEEYLTYFPMPARIAEILILSWMKLFLNNAAAAAVPSCVIRDRLEKQGCTSPIAVLPSAVDLEEMEEADNTLLMRELNLKEKPFLYAGRLAFEKSIDVIFKAVKEINRRGFYPALAVVGGGPAESFLKNLALELKLKNVFFLGWRPKDQLKHYYASSRALLFASETETQGLAAAECQSCGTPVLIAEAAGLLESVPADSFLKAEPGNAVQFAEKIVYMLEHPEQTEDWGRKAAVFVKSSFSADILLHRYEKLCLELIGCFKKI